MPCPIASKCSPCDPVLANLSSEDEDFFEYIGVVFASQQPPITPNINWTWSRSGCVGECVSTVSQDDADQCAARQQLTCNVDDSSTGGNKVPIFCNAQQECVLACPDGLPFTYTVRAGTFCSTSQIEANKVASDYACLNVKRHRICLSALNPNTGQVGTPYSAKITATGGFLSPDQNLWNVVTGSFPPGLNFPGIAGPQITISGTPTSSGTFTFLMQVQVPNGDFMQKQYTITIGGVPIPTLYWEMDEATATDRIDQIHALHLVAGAGTNWPDPVTGIINNGCVFRGDMNAPEFLDTGLKQTDANLGFAAGGINTTFWFKLNIAPAIPTIFHFFGDPSNVSVRFNFVWDPTVAGGSIVLNVITQNFGATDTIIVGAVPLSSWVLVAVTYDPLTKTVRTSLNGGAQTPTVLTNAIVPYTPGQTWINIGGFNTLNFSMDELGFWFGTVLSQSAITELFNGGTAKRPPFA